MPQVIVLILDAGQDAERHGVAVLDAEFAAERPLDWLAAYAGLPVRRGDTLSVQGPFPVIAAPAAVAAPVCVHRAPCRLM